MASTRARAVKSKGAATSVDVMNAEETESFAMYMIADGSGEAYWPKILQG